MTYGIDSHRPLTTTEKGLLIAGATLVAPHAVLAVGRGWKTLGLVRKGITMGVIPISFGETPRFPGGGGPGSGTPTSTDQARAEYYRHIYGGY